ncbi:9988_t:CDS:2, partial [Rhizophagus irregularis]
QNPNPNDPNNPKQNPNPNDPNNPKQNPNPNDPNNPQQNPNPNDPNNPQKPNDADANSGETGKTGKTGKSGGDPVINPDPSDAIKTIKTINPTATCSSPNDNRCKAPPGPTTFATYIPPSTVLVVKKVVATAAGLDDGTFESDSTTISQDLSHGLWGIIMSLVAPANHPDNLALSDTKAETCRCNKLNIVVSLTRLQYRNNERVSHLETLQFEVVNKAKSLYYSLQGMRE